ncbi:unnamed protein product [Moneuplotes crassus]|uniref:Uncharacterized protein n=2 Tax=Euplotes crassus TaxID=5936 RepID=A0AAD1XKA0_EUPCR|nr:unnamed protein product [Moneuplotes crassus]
MDSVPEERGHPTLNYFKDTDDGTAYCFLMSCGANREKQFDDVWLITVQKDDFSTHFKRIEYENIDDKFTARNGQAAVYDKDNKELLILGGQDSVNNVQYNDLFALDADYQMKKVEFDLSEGMPFPRVRNSHTLVRDHQNQKIYCYGGANASEGPLNDLYEFDQKENEWVQLLTSGKESVEDVPPPLEMHTSHLYYDEESNPQLLIFGGRSNETLSSSIYRLDLEELQWSKISEMPSIMCSHASALIKNRYVIVYGGFSGTSIFDSIRRYDIETNKWLTFIKSDADPTCEFFTDGRIATAVANANEEVVLLFGGSSALKDYNDTFVIPVEKLIDDANFSEITQVI